MKAPPIELDTMASQIARSKEDRLAAWLAAHRPILVAFSGGVDSTYLLAMARQVIGPEAIAATAEGAIFPVAQTAAARDLARRMDVVQVRFQDDILACEAFARNGADRCYVCKQRLFAQMRVIAAARGIAHIAHGANRDDRADYRPGHRAARESNIQAPMDECGLTKAEIRSLSRRLGLDTWNRPAQACLAARIAYGVPIDTTRLTQVAGAEAALERLGIEGGRVRHHGDTARIEVEPADFATLVDPTVRPGVVRSLRGLGFAHVVLDLEGYVSGSLNRALGAATRLSGQDDDHPAGEI